LIRKNNVMAFVAVGVMFVVLVGLFPEASRVNQLWLSALVVIAAQAIV
jgi:hypothetical membrane protein